MGSQQTVNWVWLTLIALSGIELAIALCHMIYFHSMRKYAPLRLASWFVFTTSIVAIPFTQMFLYMRVIGPLPLNEPFFVTLILTETGLTLILIFYFLMYRRLR